MQVYLNSMYEYHTSPSFYPLLLTVFTTRSFWSKFRFSLHQVDLRKTQPFIKFSDTQKPLPVSDWLRSFSKSHTHPP